MRTASIAAVLGVLAIGMAAPGGPDNARPAAADALVAELIRDLGSPDYRTREKAGAALEARGEKALPELRKALAEADDPEVSRRLAVLVRKMDYDRLVSPKRVTLSAKDKPAKAIVEEIGRQTGYRIEFGGGNSDAKFSIALENVPFWQAMDQVANAAGMSVYANYDDETIRVYSQDVVNPYVAYAGPFRFLATNINANRSVQLSGISRRGVPARPHEYVNLNLQVQSEPKNPILGTLQAEVTAAVDDTGASLVPPRNPNDPNQFVRTNYYNPGYRTFNTYANVNLVRGAKDATRIKHLQGKVGIVLLAGTVPEVVIPDPLKVKAKKFTGRTAEIDFDSLADGGNGTYTATMTVRKLGGNDDGRGVDYGWVNTVWQKLELVDESGGRYRTWGPNSINNNNGDVVQLTILYGLQGRGGQAPAKLGPPVKLVFNEWLQVTHEVTFEFKDVPLP
jgi:hypothetical protein